MKTVQDTMQSIGRKLSYNRYNLIRQQKRTMHKKNVQGTASVENESIISDGCGASISDDNDADEGEEVDRDDVSGTDWNARDQRVSLKNDIAYHWRVRHINKITFSRSTLS